MKVFINSLILIIFWGSACVKPKLYKAEKMARTLTEEREKVLIKELDDRKSESTRLIRQLGDLNKTIGGQETKINDLTRDLGNLTKQQGESASKLSAEKNALERDLASKTDMLNRRETALNNIREARRIRADSLLRMQTSLTKLYETYKADEISVISEDEVISLLLPDKALFGTDGTTIGETGKNNLSPLAAFLAARPGLDVEIIAYTDNVLPPKNKTLKDTWEWSLQRAINIVRLLIREYNVNANQLTPVGRGEFYPLTSNETSEGREKNRRTIVVLRPVLPAIPKSE
jgi:chemotaxis protein MotB